jgi:RNA polymerase sigma factor (sigma-70 family)
MNDDAELLRRYSEDRSEDAFAELVRRHIGWVHQVSLRRTGDRDALARDVTQQVFTLLAANASKLRRHERIGGWLYVAARFAANRALRAEARRKHHERDAQMWSELNGARPDPDWTEVRPLLDEAMDRLPETDRDALVLRFFEGRPFAEAGRALGLSEEAARKRVDRALEKLRLHLSRRGIHSTAAALAGMIGSHATSVVAAEVQSAVTTAALSAGAAGLSGGSSAAILAFHALPKAAMTFAQKLAIGALVTVAVGGAYYEIRAYQSENANIATLERRASTLRHELADLQRGNKETRLAATASTAALRPADDDVDGQVRAMRAAIDKVKQRIAADPRQAIPEFSLLSEDDWILAVERRGGVESEADLLHVLADLRNTATRRFEVAPLSQALRAFLAANGKTAPSDLHQLLPYFEPPLANPGELDRYTYIPSAALAKDARLVIGPNPDAAVDPDLDDMSIVTVEPTKGRSGVGGGGWGPVSQYRMQASINDAVTAFRRANPGCTTYPLPAELAPYFSNPADAQRYERLRASQQ